MTDDAFFAVVDEDRPKPRWRRSRKGNLYLRWAGRCLTVFKRGRWYAWSIAVDGKEPLFSIRDYRSEDEAVEAGTAAFDELSRTLVS